MLNLVLEYSQEPSEGCLTSYFIFERSYIIVRYPFSIEYKIYIVIATIEFMFMWVLEWQYHWLMFVTVSRKVGSLFTSENDL